jgi:hypothetical protein
VARLKMLEEKDPSPNELGKHLGEWVAVYGGKIIAHGKNPELVLTEAARKAPAPEAQPMIYRVPERKLLLY